MEEIEYLKEFLNGIKMNYASRDYIISQAELIYQLGIKEGLKKGYQIIKELTK